MKVQIYYFFQKYAIKIIFFIKKGGYHLPPHKIIHYKSIYYNYITILYMLLFTLTITHFSTILSITVKLSTLVAEYKL